MKMIMGMRMTRIILGMRMIKVKVSMLLVVARIISRFKTRAMNIMAISQTIRILFNEWLKKKK
jgi:hypothetical protein